MIRLFIISLLIFSLFCMVPIMGTHHSATGHLHFDASASCSTCMGPAAMIEGTSLFTLLGFVASMIPATPPLGSLAEQFHPPRAR
jgi:fumarate reductase subunit D